MFRKVFWINAGLCVIVLMLSYNLYQIWSQVAVDMKSPPGRAEEVQRADTPDSLGNDGPDYTPSPRMSYAPIIEKDLFRPQREEWQPPQRQAQQPESQAEQPFAPQAGLELREYRSNESMRGQPIPAAAVNVWTYEGEPVSATVTDRHIAVDYGRSGVLFDRKTGAVVRRLTVASGWPTTWPADFGPRNLVPRHPLLVGPVVVNPNYSPGVVMSGGHATVDSQPPQVAVAQIVFAGRIWRAMKPKAALDKVERPERGHEIAWSSILSDINEQSSLVATADDNAAHAERFTTAHGLAGNIVTHLAVHDDTLWAACIDIYNPATKKWDVGGLCRLDKNVGRWQRVTMIDGRSVRWVTAMEAIGDELWVGFREGEGVAGDQIVFGMGLYPGFYRPNATAIVVARLTQGKWTSYARKPLPEPQRSLAIDPQRAVPPTEYPTSFARLGDQVLLFSKRDAHRRSGSWGMRLAGTVSLLDLNTGQWRIYDAVKDLDADQLTEMFSCRGEVLVSSNRGLHRFGSQTAAWRLLDPQSPVKNPTIGATAVVGDELWLGYDRQDFYTIGQQGISRYSERTGQWSHMSPAELGIASPVLQFVTLPNDETWVLFGQRPWMGPTMPHLYQRECVPRPTGLGRFAAGKWEFPVAGQPACATPPRHFFDGTDNDLLQLGDSLIYLCDGAVYSGPKPWKEIVKENVISIHRVAQEQGVEIVRAAELGGKTRYQQGVYRAEGGEVTFDGNSPVRSEWDTYKPWHFETEQGAKQWAIDIPPGSRDYDVARSIQTAAAIWLLSPGQVIRCDRKALEELAK